MSVIGLSLSIWGVELRLMTGWFSRTNTVKWKREKDDEDFLPVREDGWLCVALTCSQGSGMWLQRLSGHRFPVEPKGGMQREGRGRVGFFYSNTNCQQLKEITGEIPPNMAEGLLLSQGGMTKKTTVCSFVCVCVLHCTCKAPFLLKEDTHCMRRHISSATDSMILDSTQGTRSLETVNTWRETEISR